MAETTLEKVQKVVCNVLKANEAEVTLTASFQDDLGADSLDVVELVMALEEEFGLDIPDSDVAQLKTVGEAVAYIDNLGGASTS
jgi:acyl carrier protein